MTNSGDEPQASQPPPPLLAEDRAHVPPAAADVAGPEEDGSPLTRPAATAEPPHTPGTVGRVAAAVEGAVEAAVGAATRGWTERPGVRVRRLRRRAATPLPYLYDRYPEARRASPHEVGIRTIDVSGIAGTAVGGGAQRGSDFLPLKPFRTRNWAARWQRVRAAMDRLVVLPPIDIVRYGDGYWILDGHNRVAAALYAGQIEIDASVVELVPPGGRPAERPGSLAASLTGTRAIRNAALGRRVAPIVDEDLPSDSPADEP